MNTTDAEKTIKEIRSALERGESIEVRPLPDEPQAFEIELLQAWKTLLAHWKRIVLITALFAFVGIIGGAIYYFSPKELTPPHLDLYTGVEINPEDPYGKIFSDAAKYNGEVHIYMNAINDSVQANDYDGKESDERYLTELRKAFNEAYTNTFLLGENLTALYLPVRDKDIEKELIILELKQTEVVKELECLQQEISYLSSIATVGTTKKGTATDAAIAEGVNKSRSIAKLQQEYEENVKLINELSTLNNSSEWEQQRERIDGLIQEGISTNERLSKKLNQFTKSYYERQNVSITVSKEPNPNNPEELTYKVIVGEAEQPLSPLRIPKAITFLFCCLGFGLSCLWVLRKYYKPRSNCSKNG